MPDTDAWGADPGAVIVSLVPILLWVLALVCAGIAILRGPRPITRAFVVDRLLCYLFLFPLGVQGLWAFVCQVFLPEETANVIGWEPSPFQFEVGVANLGLGVASLYAAFSGFGARAAITVVAACFLGGAGVGHLIDIAQGDNLAPGNAGPIVYTDFLTPIAVLVLLLLVPRASGQGVTRSAKVQTAPARVVEKAPQAAAPSRIEEELETARKSMRESLGAGTRPEVLSPAKPAASNQPRKSPRRGKH